MNPEDFHKQVWQQLNQTFAGAQAIGDEVQNHLRSAMMPAPFSRLDLVTQGRIR